jgi:hypothetical protein
MNKNLKILVFIFITSCGLVKPPVTCDCCLETYYTFENASKCISTKPYSETSYDPRLFLIHFVENNIEQKRAIGWKILKDPELIKKAKRNYLLIILDKKNFEIPSNLNKNKLTSLINKNESEDFFIISDNLLNIWSTWTFKDKKSTILERLGVGNGP